MSSYSTFARWRVPSNASMATSIDTVVRCTWRAGNGCHQIAGRCLNRVPAVG
jgi:hypothetical protein